MKKTVQKIGANVSIIPWTKHTFFIIKASTIWSKKQFYVWKTIINNWTEVSEKVGSAVE